MTIPSLPQSPGTDPYQRRLIAAENRVRRYCGWHISPVIEQTVVLDGSGSTALFVPTLKLRSVTACKVNGVDVDPATLEWSEDGFLRRSCGWPDRLRSVELTIEHGFEEAPEVAELIMEILFSPIGYRIVTHWRLHSVGQEYLDFIGKGEK